GVASRRGNSGLALSLDANWQRQRRGALDETVDPQMNAELLTELLYYRNFCDRYTHFFASISAVSSMTTNIAESEGGIWRTTTSRISLLKQKRSRAPLAQIARWSQGLRTQYPLCYAEIWWNYPHWRIA